MDSVYQVSIVLLALAMNASIACELEVLFDILASHTVSARIEKQTSWCQKIIIIKKKQALCSKWNKKS